VLLVRVDYVKQLTPSDVLKDEHVMRTYTK
jgi:hypothetical protein